MAYFWECPPVSEDTLDKPFEFVVIKSETLDNITQNFKSFKEHIDKGKKSFSSHSGNTLIIPPLPEKLDYKNLHNFIQNAPVEQQKEF